MTQKRPEMRALEARNRDACDGSFIADIRENWPNCSITAGLSRGGMTPSQPSAGGSRSIIRRPLKTVPRAQMTRYWDADAQEVSDDVAEQIRTGNAVRGLVDTKLPAAIERVRR